MQDRLMDFLADPHDGGPLTLHAFNTHQDEIRDGVLINAQSGRWFVIQDGIPTLFVDDLRPDDSEFVRRYGSQLKKLGCDIPNRDSDKSADFARIESERLARDDQAEEYDQMLSMKVLGLLEVPAYSAAMSEETASPLLRSRMRNGPL
jgi:uncharacterized protein YbaR (Trm112 family)